MLIYPPTDVLKSAFCTFYNMLKTTGGNENATCEIIIAFSQGKY